MPLGYRCAQVLVVMFSQHAGSSRRHSGELSRDGCCDLQHHQGLSAAGLLPSAAGRQLHSSQQNC